MVFKAKHSSRWVASIHVKFLNMKCGRVFRPEWRHRGYKNCRWRKQAASTFILLNININNVWEIDSVLIWFELPHQSQPPWLCNQLCCSNWSSQLTTHISIVPRRPHKATAGLWIRTSSFLSETSLVDVTDQTSQTRWLAKEQILCFKTLTVYILQMKILRRPHINLSSVIKMLKPFHPWGPSLQSRHSLGSSQELRTNDLEATENLDSTMNHTVLIAPVASLLMKIRLINERYGAWFKAQSFKVSKFIIQFYKWNKKDYTIPANSSS